MNGRIVASFALVPVVVFVVARAGFPIVWALSGNTGQIISPTDPATSFAALTGIVGLFVTVFGAAPTFLWMKKRGAVSLSRAIGAGVGLGNTPMLAVAVGRFTSPSSTSSMGRSRNTSVHRRMSLPDVPA